MNKIMIQKFNLIIFSLIVLFLLIKPDSNVFCLEKPNTADIFISTDLCDNIQDVDGTIIARYNELKCNDNVKLIESDSIRSNKISKIINRRDYIAIRIELTDWDQEIELSAYNLLGKKIIDIFKGRPVPDPEHEYEFSSASLPNGIYLCVLHGRNIRDAKRFVVSR